LLLQPPNVFLAKNKVATTSDLVRRTFLGLTSYIVLEGGMFRTVYPSSSIALGAYANTRSTLRSSIVSTSSVATGEQRRQIQALGKRFGCHQCGDRQLFNRLGFIADHMPPTKRAEELSSKWWRRILNLKVQSVTMDMLSCYSCSVDVVVQIQLSFLENLYKSYFSVLLLIPFQVKQRLWPQCQKCFSVQGSAVRTWSHFPIYHSAWKIHHFAPVVAIIIDQNEEVRKVCDDLLRPVSDGVDKICKYFEKK
jgi:hypothetical protein